ncbi:dynamin family protein [Halomonas sp. 18H]|nr:dynamin family protein [Halomonas sp. 18H]MCW4153679.1 dynamin family protein [Halomonas sp. 18H]
MLQIQTQYCEYLSESAALLADTPLEKEGQKILRDELVQAELLVPVVGAFSAGKSTMLNKFLGREVLPVDIAPETDLATELRHSSDERIEAVRDDGSMVRFDLNDMVSIKPRATEFSYLRLYVESRPLLEMAPLVLVDMPGFDSSLANHNKAIGRYIGKGAHYLVMTSVEDGSITKSIQRQLNDICNLGQSFSFFLSKSNLKSADELADVVARVKDQAYSMFGENVAVVPIGGEEAERLKGQLQEIDPEYLFQQMYSRPMKNFHLDIIDNLNLAVSGMKKEAGESEETIHEMECALDRIITKRDQMLQEIKARHTAAGVDRCAQAVEVALGRASEELTGAAMSGDKDALGRVISDIVRSVLLTEVKREMKDINRTVVDKLSVELRGINSTLGSTELGEGWMDDFTGRAREGAQYLSTSMHSLSNRLSSQSDSGRLYKALATTVAVTTSIVAPLIELLIIFLPELLSGLMRKRQREELRAKITGEMIPGVKRELQGKLPVVFDEQLEQLVREVSESFEGKIKDQQTMLERVAEDKKAHIGDINQQVEELNKVRKTLQNLASKYVYQEAYS